MTEPTVLPTQSQRLIVWGAGELGGRVAARWAATGRPAIGLTQSRDRHPELAAQGILPRLGSAVDRLRPEDTLLLSLPGHRRQRMAVEALIAAVKPAPLRVLLISTTGYYGTPAGRVDEETPPGPEERAQSIAATEQRFQAWAGPAGVILRLGGLYGPGRGPLAALARRGAPRLGPPNRTLALIHYVDVAAAIYAALTQPAKLESVYLAVTPPCPTRAEFYRPACEKLGLPEPEFEPALNQPPADYDVSRLRRDLLPEPAYPDWWAALELPLP